MRSKTISMPRSSRARSQIESRRNSPRPRTRRLTLCFRFTRPASLMNADQIRRDLGLAEHREHLETGPGARMVLIEVVLERRSGALRVAEDHVVEDQPVLQEHAALVVETDIEAEEPVDRQRNLRLSHRIDKPAVAQALDA